MTRWILFAMVILFAFTGMASAAPLEQWNTTFGGANSDGASSVQQTPDGGYIIAGHTESYGMGGGGDAWLIKTNPDGNEQWNRTFGGTGWECVNSVQQTSNGGYILASYTQNAIGEAWLIKTDSDGNEQWNRTFWGADYSNVCSVQQTLDGGYILAGFLMSYGAGNTDAWLIKTDPDGNEQWNRTFGGVKLDYAYSVQQTIDGGYVLAGHTESYGYDAWLIKTDPDGNEQWNRTFGGARPDHAYSVQQTSNGGYILAGGTESYGVDFSDFLIIKADADGNEQWNRTFGGIGWDSASSVQQTSNGGYVLAGTTGSYGGAWNLDAWLIKVSTTKPIQKGDLNHDGNVTSADAAIALRIAASGAHDDAADVSGDGRVTSLDALMIMQAAAGRIEL